MASSVSADAKAPGTASLRERIVTLGRQTFVYGLAGAASQAVGIVTLPIFARVFNPSQYGVLEIATVGYSALLVLADISLTSGAQRSYYDYDDDQEAARRSALFTGLAASMAIAGVIMLVLLAFANSSSRWAFGSTHYVAAVRIVAVTVPLGVLAAFAREAMRLKFRPWQYTASALLGSVGAAAIAMVAVLAFHAGINGVLLGVLIGTLLSAVYGFIASRRYLIGSFSVPELRTMFAYGLPLIPAAAAMWGLSFVDRLILARVGSLADTGEYAVANRFGFVLTLMVTAFATAFGPFQLSLWREDPIAEKRVRDHTLTYLTIALVGTGVVFAVFAREIIAILAPSYELAYKVVGLLVMSVVFWGIANLVLFGIGLMRQTRAIAIWTAVALVANIALNFLLIPAWGVVGASLANLIAYVLLAIAYYRKSQALYPTDYSLGKPAKVICAGALAMAVGALPLANTPLVFGVKLATVALFALSIPVLRVIGEPELAELRAVAVRVSALRKANT